MESIISASARHSLEAVPQALGNQRRNTALPVHLSRALTKAAQPKLLSAGGVVETLPGAVCAWASLHLCLHLISCLAKQHSASLLCYLN